MIDSERREDLPRTLGRGEGITSLREGIPRFRWVLYEGGRPYPREDFDWDVALQGLIAPGKLSEVPGDRRGTEAYK